MNHTWNLARIDRTLTSKDSAQTNVGGGVQPRPDVVGNIGVAEPNRQQWFNTAAFPLSSGFDALRLQFRADMFSAFNSTRLGNPNTTQGIAQFGQISSAASGRVIQMALKLIF